VLKIAQHKGTSIISWDIQKAATLRVIEGGAR
jgi:hypothetical protein